MAMTAVTASADNRLYVNDVQVDVGEDIFLPVYLNNTDSITAFQFDFTLPDGLLFGEERVSLEWERTPNFSHSIICAEREGGDYRVICYSNDLDVFEGDSGLVAYICFAAPTNPGTYSLTIKDIEMTGPSLTKYLCDNVTVQITVGSAPSSAENDAAMDRFMKKYAESIGVYNDVKAETVEKLLDEEGNVINNKYADLVTEFIAELDNYKKELDDMKSDAEEEYASGELPDNIEMYIETLTYSDKSIQEAQKAFLMAMENLDKYIAFGEVGTCIWYITNDGQLVIMPEDGESGDLPETGWDKDNMTPWYAYRSDIKSAKVLGGVNATSCAFMFSDLTNMESIDLSGLNTKHAVNMENMFASCHNLLALDVSNLITENAVHMESMFKECYSLKSLDVSNFDTHSAIMMNGMFKECSGLTSLDISNFNTENVTRMYSMFNDCTNLKTLNLTNFNTVNVEDLSNIFDGCDSLTTIISNNATPSSLKPGTFSESFVTRANCTLLVPEGTKALYAAADGWNELGKILDGTEPVGPEIPADAIASGETGTCIWYITSEGELVIAPANGVSGDLPEEGWNPENRTPWYAYRDSITAANIMNGVKVVSCAFMFHDLSLMKSANLSGLNTAKTTSMNSMFYGCKSLETLDISSFDTHNVGDMSGMFSDCSSLKGLDLTHFDTKNVWNMGYMFHGCDSLEYLNLGGNFNTENVSTMNSMFYGCKKISSMGLTNFNTQNVTEMSGMFYGCSGLQSVDISSFDTKNVWNMGYMFAYCGALKELNLSNFDTRNVSSMAYMFAGCVSLTSIDLSPLNTQNVLDMSYMFMGCAGIDSLNVSNLITKNVTKMSGMFSGCFGLTTLDMTNFNMESVAEMDNMFSLTNGISRIISNLDVPSLLKPGIFSTFGNSSKCRLIVPEGSRELYAAADGWNELGRIDDGTQDPNVLAQGESGSCTWKLNKDGELVIAPNSENGGELDNWVAKGEKAPWADQSGEVRRVTIEDGVGGLVDGMLGDLNNMGYVNWNTNNSDIPQGIFGTEENNAIIYAPQGVDSDRDHNVVIDGVAEKIILKDGYPLEIPEAFEADYIYYVRDFTKATKTGHSYGWESIVLPYDVQHFVHQSKGNLAPFGSEGTTKRPFWLGQFANNGVFSLTGEMKANVPYVIAMPNDSIYDENYILRGKVAFISYNTTVYPTDEAESIESSRATMHGSYEFMESPDYYAVNDDIFDGYMPGAVFGSGLTVKPFYAYMNVHDKEWEANKRVFIINVNDNDNDDDNDNVNGIVDVNDNDNDKVVYDLNGIRINPSQMKRGRVYLKLKNSKIEKFKY